MAGMISRSLELDGLNSAPLACYAVWRGREDDNPAMIDASRQLYLRALQETQKALSSPEAACTDATLASCNALGLYEALECPDGTELGYRWHRSACCRLLQLRGPAAHRTGFAHVLFLAIRTFGVSSFQPLTDYA
jgi:hypothetical protein